MDDGARELYGHGRRVRSARVAAGAVEVRRYAEAGGAVPGPDGPAAAHPVELVVMAGDAVADGTRVLRGAAAAVGVAGTEERDARGRGPRSGVRLRWAGRVDRPPERGFRCLRRGLFSCAWGQAMTASS